MIELGSRLLQAIGLPWNREQRLDPAEVARRVLDSGLFDPGFYSATYGLDLVGDALLRHFLELGMHRGYLPSATFDPVLYRVLVPACGRSNPLLHFRARGGDGSLPSLTEAFPELIAKYARKQREPGANRQPAPDRVQRYMDNIAEVAAQREIRISVPGADYSIQVPRLEYFLDRLNREQVFAFARLPHGYWDALVTRRAISEDARLKSLPEAQRLALAGRIAAAALPHHGGFAEGLFDELAQAVAARRGDPDFLSAVAFKGFFDAGDGAFRPNFAEKQKDVRLELFRQHFSPSDPLMDATVWKRYADAGELPALAQACRSRHVVLLGPGYLGELGRRWGVRRFTHVEIETSHSQKVRWSILHRLQQALAVATAEPGPRTVLVTMCGGSFAYWIFSRVFASRRDVFCIDLGQAIRVWFPDVETNSPWMNLYLAAQARQQSGDA